MEAQLIAVLGLGFFLGLRHATDADHVVAVTTFVSRERSILRSCWIGASWGIGHTAALALAGVAVIGFQVTISPYMESWLETLVAVMLVGLGFRALFQRHAHEHAGATRPHRHSFVVGMVHGAAGSAALMLLVLSTIRNPLQAMAYIALFGFGSVIGMFLISLLLALPMRWVAARAAAGYRRVQLMAGAMSCLLGIYLLGRG